MAEKTEGIVRFTMVVTTVEKNEAGELVLSGLVKGRTGVGEKVYLILPMQAALTEIKGIEEVSDGQASAVSVIENAEARINISLKAEASAIPKFCVLSSIKPHMVLEEKAPVENPAMLAMILENRRLGQDNIFRSALIYNLVHSAFLIPMKSDIKPEAGESGLTQIPKNARLSFVTLPDLKDVNDKTKRVLPVFTDWIELHRWRQKANPDNDTQTIAITYPQLLGIFKENENLTGLVINPMSHDNILFAREPFMNISKLEAYQKEFVRGEGRPTAPTPGAPARLSAPDTEEINSIRRILSDYCLGNPEMVQLHLLLREEMTESKRKSYYILMETEGDKQKVLRDISEALNSHVKDVTQIDFAWENEIKKLEETLPLEALVYRRV